MEKQEKPSLDKESATAEITMILQQICQMGAVDSEPDTLRRIIKQMEEDKLSPEEAVQAARKLESERQDYH